MKKFIVFVLLLSSFAYSAAIKEIQFNGLIHISQSIALESLPFSKGDQLNEEQITDSIHSFYKKNYFINISVRFENGVLIYFFTEKPLISRIDYAGYFDNDDEQAREIIGLKKGNIYDTKKVKKAKNRIIEYLESEGYIDSVVEIKTERLSGNSIEVNFIINRGKEIEIEKLNFYGRKGISRDDLEDQVANQEAQSFAWWFGRHYGEMKKTDLKYDSLRLKEYYMKEGYLDAVVDKPLVIIDFDRYKARMSYNIKEGMRYKVKSIDIAQEEEIVKKSILKEALHLEADDMFNVKKMRSDISKIKNLVADRGYAFAKVYPDLDKDAKNGLVSITYHIDYGKKVYINDVIISGNDRTLDRIIRREIYLAPTDLYTYTDFSDSKKALGRTGYFESQTIELKRVDSSHVDILVKVKEAQTGTLQLGGGYGSYAGFMVDASVSDLNIFGSGINMAFSVSKSDVGKNVNISISNPRFNDSLYSLSWNLFKSEFDYPGYSTNQDGFGTTLGKRLNRELSASLGYKYLNSEYSDIGENNAISYVGFTTDPYTKSSVILGLSYNSTDNYYVPREGIVANTKLEYAGAGGVAQFNKSFSQFSVYFGLMDYINSDIILRFKSRLGLIEQKDFLPVEDKFYMGGVRSVRGYNSYSLSPRGGSSNISTGGKKTSSGSVEASFPLVPKSKLRLAIFYDYGIIGQDKIDEIQRSSTGFAIEWFSPMGPLQLIFARPLDKEVGDRTSTFEFTLGQRF